MKNLCAGLLLCLNSLALFAQVSPDTLEKYGRSMLEGKAATERIHAGEVFGRMVDQLLISPESFAFPDNHVKSISILESPDHVFRLLTWNVPLDSGRYIFSGRVQLKNPYRVIVLKDVSYTLQKPESKTLRNGDWFGAIYYQIIPPVSRKNKIYTLLGWNGHDGFSNKKLIETMQINRNGTVVFGVPILFDGRKRQQRIIFEYAEKASMSLKYYEKTRSIIFDHLSAPQPSLEGMYAFYGPDFSYDAYRLKKGTWHFEKNIDVRNEDDNKGRLQKAPEKGLPPAGKKKSPK